MSNKSEELKAIYDELSWDNYIEVADSITKFDAFEIDSEMTRQASIYSYYQGLLSLAKQALDNARLELTKYCASTSQDYKDRTPGKVSVRNLDNYVESSEMYSSFSKIAIRAEFKYTILKGLVGSLDHKKDMLIQLSSNRRAETNLYK